MPRKPKRSPLRQVAAAVESDAWPEHEAAAVAAIGAIQVEAAAAVFPPEPRPLDLAVRSDINEHLASIRHAQIVDRVIELHGAALSSYPSFAEALRGTVGVGRVRASVQIAAAVRGEASREYIAAEIARFQTGIAAQLVEAGDDDLAAAAGELLYARQLTADLEQLRADRAAFESERAESERDASIAEAAPLVERLRQLPAQFFLPLRKGADYRQPRERTTAAELAAELADGQHGGRLDELAAIVIKAEQRRRMGARW